MGKHGQGTHSIKMGEIGRKYPKCLKIFWPNLFAQAQKFGVFEKTSLGVRSPCPKTQTNFPLKFMKRFVTKFARIAIPKITQIPHTLFGRSTQIEQNILDIIEKVLIGCPYSVT